MSDTVFFDTVFFSSEIPSRHTVSYLGNPALAGIYRDLKFNDRSVLPHVGKVSREAAERLANPLFAHLYRFSEA